jgi:hypothetical protein
MMALSKHDRELHRKMMASCFNECWEYLEKRKRTDRDRRRMLTLSHAARFHAEVAGTPKNQAIGDWQISRVYAALQEPRLALGFATSSLELCERNGLSDILCTAYEAVARAHAVNNNLAAARDSISKARDALDASSVDEEGREIFLGQIRETEKLIRRAETSST